MSNWYKNSLSKFAEQAKQATNTLAQQATQQLGQPQRISDLQQENELLRQQVSALESQLRASEGTGSVHPSPSEAEVNDLNEHLQQVLQASAQKDEELRRSNKASQTLEAKLEMMHSNLEAERMQHAAQLEELKNAARLEAEAMQATNAQLQQQVQQLANAAGTGGDGAAAAQLQLAQLQIQELQSDKQSLQAAVHQLEDKCQALADQHHAEKQRLQQAVDHAEQQAAGSQALLEQLQDEVKALSVTHAATVQQLQQHHTDLTSQLQEKLATTDAALQQAQDSYDQEISALQQQLSVAAQPSGADEDARASPSSKQPLTGSDSLDFLKMVKELEELRQFAADAKRAYKAKAEAESKVGMLEQRNKQLQAKLQQLEPLLRKQDAMDIQQLSKHNSELKAQLRAAQSALEAAERNQGRIRSGSRVSVDYDDDGGKGGTDSPAPGSTPGDTPRASQGGGTVLEDNWMEELEEFKQRQESLQELMKEYQSTVNGGEKVVVLKQLNELYSAHVEGLQRQCAQLHSKNQGLERTLKEAQLRCNELERNKSQERDLLRCESNKAVGDLQQQVDTLLKQLQSLEQQAQADRSTAAHVEVELQDKLEAAQKEQARLQQQLQQQQAAAAEAGDKTSKQATDLQQRILTLEAELSSKRDLEQQLEAELASKQEVERQVEELQGANRKLLQGVSQLHSTLVTNKAEGANGTADAGSPHSHSSHLSGFDGVAYQLEAFQVEIEQLQVAMQEKDKEAAHKLESMQLEADRALTQLNTLSQQHDQLSQQLHGLQAEHLELSQQKGALLAERDQLQQEVQQLLVAQEQHAKGAAAAGIPDGQFVAAVVDRCGKVAASLRELTEEQPEQQLLSPSSESAPNPAARLKELAEGLQVTQVLLQPGGDVGDDGVAAVSASLAMVLQQLQQAVVQAAGAAVEIQASAHTAELDAEQLRQELMLRNQQHAQQIEGETTAMQAQLLTLQSEAQHWSERLDSAGEIALALKEQVQRFEAECAELRNMLKGVQEEYATSQQGLNKALEDADDLARQLHEARAETQQLRQQLDAAQAAAAGAQAAATVSDTITQQVQELQAQLQAAKDEATEAQTQVQAAAQQVQTAKEETEKARSQAEVTAQQLLVVSEQAAEARAQAAAAAQELQTAREEAQEVRRQAEATEQQLQRAALEAHGQAEATAQQAANQQAEQLSSVQSQLRVAREEGIAAQNQVAQLTDSLGALEAQCTSLTNQLQDSVQQCTDLQAQCQSLQANQESAAVAEQHLQQEVQAVRHELAAARTQSEAAEQRVLNLQGQLEKAELAVAQATARAAAAESQVTEGAAGAKERMAKLQEQLASQAEALAAAQEEKHELLAQIDQLQLQQQSIDEQLATVMTHKQELQEQLSAAAAVAAADKHVLEQQLAVLQEAAAAANPAFEQQLSAIQNAAAADKQGLEQQLAALQESAAADKQAMEQTIEDLQASAAASAAEKAALQAQVESLTQQIAQQQEAVAARESHVAAREAELQATAEAATKDNAAQQELAMQAVQQLADARSTLAQTQAELAEAQRDLLHAQTSISEKSKQLKESKQQESRAIDRCQQLEQELQAASEQGKAARNDWEQERGSLNERLTRLQKINQSRRAEMDDLQAKLVVAQHSAASNDALSSEVKMLQQEGATLRQRSEKLQAKVQEAEAAQQQLQAKIAALNGELVVAQKQVLSVDGKAVAACQERDSLQEKLTQLRAENKRLSEALGEAAAMKEHLQELEGATDELEVERGRSSQLEMTRDRMQRELQTISNMVVKLEDKLRVTEEEVEQLTAQLDEERRKTAKVVMSFAEELEGLAAKRNDRSAWPTPVRLLVEQVESAAAEEAAAQLRAGFESEVAELESTSQSLRDKADEAVAAREQAEKDKAVLAARLQQLEQEVQEREIAVQEQLVKAQSGSSRRSVRLEADLTAAKAELDRLRAESSAEAQQHKQAVESLSKDLEEVRGRARMMMEEKDATIAALRKEARQSAAASGAATPQALTPAPGSGSFLRPAVLLPDGAVVSGVPDDDDGGVATQPSALDHAHVTGTSGYSVQGGTALLSRVITLEQQLAKVSQELEDAEKTNRLRENAQQVLKEELAEIRRQEKRNAVNVDYLKNVLVDGFANGELPTSTPMFLVLSRLLLFSPDDLARIKTGAAQHTTSQSPSFASLLRPLQIPALSLSTVRTTTSTSARSIVSPRASQASGRPSGPVGGGQGWEATMQVLQSAAATSPMQPLPMSPAQSSSPGGIVQQLFASAGSTSASPEPAGQRPTA